jgi:hypothetical protein
LSMKTTTCRSGRFEEGLAPGKNLHLSLFVQFILMCKKRLEKQLFVKWKAV